VLALRSRGVPRLITVAFSLMLVAAGMELWHMPEAAAAASCAPETNPTNDHCYAIAQWNNIGYNYEGAYGEIKPHCLYSSSTANGNFVSQEMWEGTDSNGNGSTWIEEGAIYSPSLRWFWANFYPGASQVYVYYQGPSVSLDTTYLAQMYYTGNKDWEILATPQGQSTWDLQATAHYQPLYTNALSAGTEYTTGGDRTVGSASDLQYQRTDSTMGDWWNASPVAEGPSHYATATMPSANEVDWSSQC